MWMPIESAPKQTEVLVLFVDGRMRVATQVQIGGHGLTAWRYPWGTWLDEPTHWRPLPEPPPTDNRSGIPEGEDAW